MSDFQVYFEEVHWNIFVIVFTTDIRPTSEILSKSMKVDGPLISPMKMGGPES